MRVVLSVAFLLGVLAAPQPSYADLPVLVLPDDNDSHARATNKIVRLSLWSSLVDAHGGDGGVTATWFQVGIGPIRHRLPFRGASLGALDRWSARLRVGSFVTNAADAGAIGPLTIAVQRIAPLDIIDVLPLLHGQVGLEIAVASPWLYRDNYEPGRSLRVPYGPEFEVVERGWSLRPAAAHVRFDLLACRSWFVELGAGSEIFRSTAERDRPLAFGGRWHADLGVALACKGRRRKWRNDLAIVGELRGRFVAFRGDEDTTYDGGYGLSLQYNPGPVSFAIIGSALATAPMIGVRLQYSLVPAKGSK